MTAKENKKLIKVTNQARKALSDCILLIEDMSRFVGNMSLRDYALLNEAPINARKAIKELVLLPQEIAEEPQ